MALAEVTVTSPTTYAASDYGRTPKLSTFGGETDIWGTTPSVASLTPDFAVLFDADIDGGILTVEDIELEIFYTMPTGNTDINPALVDSVLSSCAIGAGPSGRNRVVVVGKAGLIRISDDDGASWTEKNSNTASTLRQVRYGNGEFVAVGENGTMVVSPNGNVWAVVAQDTAAHLYAISFDNSRKRFYIGGAGKIRRNRG